MDSPAAKADTAADADKIIEQTASVTSEDADLTLAQQIAENERQMYEQSQIMMQEIEDEV